MDMRQIKALEARLKHTVLSIYPDCPECAGIYIFEREEEGIKYAYVGQAKNILQRVAEHLRGYQHIDLSLKKRGFAEWRLSWVEADFFEDLDELEREYIKKYAQTHQMYNKTTGGQGTGKKALGETKERRGYYDGLENGKAKTKAFVVELFEKHLQYAPKSEPPTKAQEKAMLRFEEFLKHER